MKKLFFSCFLLLFGIQVNGQSCGDNGYWKIGSQFGTQRLSSNCGDFICHGFAAAYWENGFTSGSSLNPTTPGTVNVTAPFTYSGGFTDPNYFKTQINTFKFVIKACRMWM